MVKRLDIIKNLGGNSSGRREESKRHCMLQYIANIEALSSYALLFLVQTFDMEASCRACFGAMWAGCLHTINVYCSMEILGSFDSTA